MYIVFSLQEILQEILQGTLACHKRDTGTLLALQSARQPKRSIVA